MLIWVWSCADSGSGPCRWSCTERRSGPPSSSGHGASTGLWGCPAPGKVQRQWVNTHPSGGGGGVWRKWPAFDSVRNSPRCAPGRRSGSRPGWPLQCGPRPRCSGPAQAGWCSLGHWCCLCVSSQTGSPPGRLKDNIKVIFHRWKPRWLSRTLSGRLVMNINLKSSCSLRKPLISSGQPWSGQSVYCRCQIVLSWPVRRCLILSPVVA